MPNNVPTVGVHNLCTQSMYSHCIGHGSCHLHIRPNMDKTAETKGYVYTQGQAYKSTVSMVPSPRILNTTCGMNIPLQDILWFIFLLSLIHHEIL